MSKLLPIIQAQCRVYFGTRAKRYADNRCDACPLRSPCLAFGHAPAHTFEQLDASRVAFNNAATTIIGSDS